MNGTGQTLENVIEELLRRIVREEIQAASNSNGHSSMLTAKQLAKKLQVNKATVYEWVKAKSIPYYQAGRFIRFNLQEVLESQKKEVAPLDKS